MPTAMRIAPYEIEFPLSDTVPLNRGADLPSSRPHVAARALLDACDAMVTASQALRRQEAQEMLARAGKGEIVTLPEDIRAGSPADPRMPTGPLSMITGWRVDYGRGQVMVSACVPEGKDPADLQREICVAVEAAVPHKAA